MSKQAREEQYRPITANTPPQRRAPGLSPSQTVPTSSGSARGKQGK